jgi:nucleotidyltransferase/DNA polymerase involved in DNA repair
MFARLATARAKPDGSYHLLQDAITGVLEGLELNDLHGFGRHTRQKAIEKLGTASLQGLMSKSKGQLCEALGKGTGETLYKALRGIDDKKIESDKVRKSVSCDVNVCFAGACIRLRRLTGHCSMAFESRTMPQLKSSSMIWRDWYQSDWMPCPHAGAP